MKNYYYIQDHKYINFCELAREFFHYLRSQDRESWDKEQFVERPYAYQMTRKFAEEHGMDMSIMDDSPYFSDSFRYLFTSEERKKPTLPPHMDTCPDGLVPATINFPLINCDERTVTSWYRIRSGVPSYIINTGGEINSSIAANKTPETEGCELERVDRVSFMNNQPHLFRTSRWHEVSNLSGSERVTCSLFFKPPMIYDDIVDHLKERNII